jgi:hypothetical protein
MPLFPVNPKAVNEDINKISWLSHRFCEVFAIFTTLHLQNQLFRSADKFDGKEKESAQTAAKGRTRDSATLHPAGGGGSCPVTCPALGAYGDIKDEKHKIASQWSSVDRVGRFWPQSSENFCYK